MAAGVYDKFPVIYQKEDDGGSAAVEEEEDGEKGVQKGDEGSVWGLTPLLLAVCQQTMTPLHDIYGWAVTEFLYYASFHVELERKKLKEIKKITNKR